MSAATVVLRDVLAGIVRVRESLEDGDAGHAYTAAAQAEDELAGAGARELARLRVELEVESEHLRELAARLLAAIAPPPTAAMRGGG